MLLRGHHHHHLLSLATAPQVSWAKRLAHHLPYKNLDLAIMRIAEPSPSSCMPGGICRPLWHALPSSGLLGEALGGAAGQQGVQVQTVPVRERQLSSSTTGSSTWALRVASVTTWLFLTTGQLQKTTRCKEQHSRWENNQAGPQGTNPPLPIGQGRGGPLREIFPGSGVSWGKSHTEASLAGLSRQGALQLGSHA